MKEAVVDTSVLVDAVVEEARRHLRARAQLAGLAKLTVPIIVLYEMVWVLEKLGAESDAVRNAVETLVRNPKVTIAADDGAIASKAIGRVVEEKTSLSNFDDKVVLETALRLGVPLLTYDRELERESRRAGAKSLG